MRRSVSAALRLLAPGFAVPSNDAFEHRHDIVRKQAKQDFAFFGSGRSGMANVSGFAPFPGDPCARSRFKRRTGVHELGPLIVGHQMWSEAKHHRWFPFTDRKSTRLNSSHLGISYAIR